MKLNNYYYHTILKDALSKEELYENLEIILKDGYIKSRSLLENKKDNKTYNGDNYISIAEYNEPSIYKVINLTEEEFSRSSLNRKFATYQEYLDRLKENEFIEAPLSKEEYFKKYNATDKREYFNYLDKITKTYPVDIKMLLEKTKDPIFQEILNISKEEIINCYPSENAFNKYVLETNGITFIFPNTINVIDVSIIPNLPLDIENALVSKISTLPNRYSNLLGEKQVKDKISIKDAIGIIIKDNLEESKIEKLLEKYNYKIKIYEIKEGEIMEKETKYFYHVVTNKPMYIGQKISFTDDNQSGVYKRVMEKESLVNDIYAHPENYHQEDLDHHTKVALRELAMEEIRQKHYPNYPSRIKSLYVSTDLEDSYMWANSFIKKGRVVFQIVKLKTTGNSFTGNAYNCFEGTTSKEHNLKESYAYWDNIIKNENEIIYETIIDGEIEVVDIIETFDK